MRAKDARKRQSKGLPWFRKFDGWWYATVDGQRMKLARGDESKPENNREEAVKEWVRLMSLAHVEDNGETNYVWALFERYLDHIQKNHPGSYGSHNCYCQSFKDKHPELRVRDLTVHHVESWLEDHGEWSDSTVNFALSVVLAALNYAANPKRRYIKENPLRGLTRPPIRSRGAESIVDPETFKRIYDAAMPWVKDALFFLRQTGTRPNNLHRITASTIDPPNRCIRIEQHKTRGKIGKPLVIPLTEPALKLLLRLAEKYPEGPLFRGQQGNPMTGHCISSCWQYLKRKLKLSGNPLLYGLRHGLATELLSKDVPDAKVAFIMGHKGTAMIYHHYAHLDSASKFIAEELDRAINGDAAAEENPGA